MAYSSVDEVTAFTRHLLNGQTGFNEDTNPTRTDVETFLARVSAVLDLALAGQGFATPITQATALLACDDWVTVRVTEYVELTQRGVGYTDAEGSRTAGFRNLHSAAEKFAKENRLGFVRLGATVTSGVSQGLQFTGLAAADTRADPENEAFEQPRFTRGQFEDPRAV